MRIRSLLVNSGGWRKKTNFVAQTMLGLHTCTKVRLTASTQDGIKLRLVSSHFVFPSTIQFLSPKQTQKLKKKKEHDQASQLHECHNTKPTYLSVLFDQGDVNGLSFVTISLYRARHIEPIKHTVDISVHMR